MKTNVRNFLKSALIIAVVMCCFSCEHPKEGMIVKGADGKYYILDSEGQSMPTNAYRLREIDSSQVKVQFK